MTMLPATEKLLNQMMTDNLKKHPFYQRLLFVPHADALKTNEFDLFTYARQTILSSKLYYHIMNRAKSVIGGGLALTL